MSEKMIVPLNDPDFKAGGGVVSQLGWRRLERLLKSTGELREGEQVAGYAIDNSGIRFYIEKS